MTIIFSVIEVIILTSGILLTAWYRPSWIKRFAGFLSRFSDAVQAFRQVINGPSVIKVSRKPDPPSPIAFTQVQQDVVDALIAQGATPRQAKASVSQAIESCGPQAGFDELWRKASVAA